MTARSTHKGPTIIEAEIIDENGIPVTVTEEAPRLHARPKGDTGGLIGGFFVLAFGFLVTLFVAAFTVFVILPLTLIGRVLGLEIKRFTR